MQTERILPTPQVTLGEELENHLLETNPWWRGKPMPALPSFRRWLFGPTLQRLKDGLAPITALRGPRQVGKTTLQGQVIRHLLENENIAPTRIFRVQFDELPAFAELKDPILTLCRWYQQEILGRTFNEARRDGQMAYLFFDEAQNLDAWAPELKALVDHHDVRVLLTGSSALRIEHGRDSLAGRITTLELNTLLLREIASLRGWDEIPPVLPLNGLRPLMEKAFWEELRERGINHRELRNRAFDAFSERGGYPISQARADILWEFLADQLNETVIRRAILHDLTTERNPGLLEELFRLCCRYAGQAPAHTAFGRELETIFPEGVPAHQIQSYLQFLNDTLLIRLVHPLELRLKQRSGSAKICLCDHSLRASWLQENVPLTLEGLERSSHLTDLAGRLAESVLGSFLSSMPGLDVAWFPERASEPEVDFVLTVGERRIPVEVKYRRRIEPNRDTAGLRSFIDKEAYNAPFGILVTLTDDVVVSDPRIVTLPLSSLLLMR